MLAGTAGGVIGPAYVAPLSPIVRVAARAVLFHDMVTLSFRDDEFLLGKSESGGERRHRRPVRGSRSWRSPQGHGRRVPLGRKSPSLSRKKRMPTPVMPPHRYCHPALPTEDCPTQMDGPD